MSVSSSVVQPGKTFFERVDGTYVEWYVADLVFSDDGVSAILTRGDRRATVDADELAAAIANDADSAWVPAMFTGNDERNESEWIPHPRLADETADCSPDDVDVGLRVAPDNPTDLTFEKIEGRGSRTEVNTFLEGAEDGLVVHELGGVASWKAAFVARYDGAIVSVIVLHHYHPSTNGTEIAITRLANHPSAPDNTSTWMIARARRWAERVGYDRVATYSGVGENAGTCYAAAGFDPAGDPVEVTGKDWVGERGDATWHKQKWVYELEPETYADKSSEWAVATVVDRITVPESTTESTSGPDAAANGLGSGVEV